MMRSKQSDAPFKRGGGKRGSGVTHVRYGHKCRPTVLDVCCTRCGGRASARKPSESEMGVIVGDTCGTWHLADWMIRCVSCPLRVTGLSYSDLPALYYEEDGFYAWNRDHLLFLADSFHGHDTSGNPYGVLGTYIKGEWLRHKKKSIRTIGNLLSRDSTGEQTVDPNA